MQLLKVKNLALVLGCHEKTVYRLVEENKIPYLRKEGLGVRFRKEDLDSWLAKAAFTPPQISDLSKPKFLDTPRRAVVYREPKGGKHALGKNPKRWNFGFGTVYQRETKHGKCRWYLDFNAGGKRIRRVVKNAQTRGEAVIALQEKAAEAFGKERGLQVDKKMRFSELADQYVEDYARANKRSWRSDQYRIEANLKPYFGDVTLQDISPLLIEKYRVGRLKDGVSKSTVNRETTILKKMFNLAIDWGFSDQNPVLKVRLFSEKGTAKERILSDEEEVKLLARCPVYLRLIVITALSTGMRRGEILNLRWRNVDLKKRLIKVEQTKSGSSRVIPINGCLYDELVKVRERDGKSELLFPNPETGLPYTQVRKGFKNACKKAGVKELRFHDLRHTFATRLIESGVDLITVRDLLGHFSVRVTQRYTHPSQEKKKQAVELLAARAEIQPENSETLAHICHILETEKTSRPVIPLFSLN